ncbi:MAG TPA: DUF1634 domain-containing protein [Anaeromyxobacter sp.]|nr:DUF1634 domain-containing protein [Anaeromyxobacter sp.]
MDPRSDVRMERLIGGILRVGVAAATGLVLCGEALHLARQGGARPDFGSLGASVPGLAGMARVALEHPGRGLVELGLLVLVATPVARVAFSVLAFAVRRDWTYVVVTLVVLALLGLGLAAAPEGEARPAQPASAAAMSARTSSRSAAASRGP